MNPSNDDLLQKMTQAGILGYIMNDDKKAESELKKAAKKFESHPIALYNYGLILFIRERFSDSVEVLKKALELNPVFPEAWVVLDRALRSGGNVKEARDTMSQLFTDTTGTFVLPKEGGEVKVIDGIVGYDKGMEALIQQVRSSTRKDLNFAGLWNNQIVNKIRDISGNIAMGGTHAQLEEHQLPQKIEGLSNDLDTIIEFDASIGAAWLNKAGLLFMQQKMQEIEPMLADAIDKGYIKTAEIASFKPGSFRYSMPSFIRSNWYDNAEKAQADWREVDRGIRIIENLYEQKRIDDAEAAARETLEYAPDSGFAHYFIGLSLLSKDKTDDAIEFLEKAHELDYSIGVASQLADLYKSKGEKDKAKQIMKSIK